MGRRLPTGRLLRPCFHRCYHFLFGFAFLALPRLLVLGLNGSTFFWVVFTIYSMAFSASLGGTIVPFGAVPFSGLGQVSVFWPLVHPRGFLRLPTSFERQTYT